MKISFYGKGFHDFYFKTLFQGHPQVSFGQIAKQFWSTYVWNFLGIYNTVIAKQNVP